ncbi:MAG: VOC family protein [Novosphingobium sp.]|nr:VOC family protein [Novosphingobium sp.]
MFSYATVGSNRLEEAKQFYDELLALDEMSPMMDHGSGGRIYSSADGRLFGVLGPFNGEPASAGNGSMFGFMVDSQDKVSAMHAKAIELGGTCDGAPGLRGPAEANNFGAYFRDLDGNKLCAICMGGA